MPSCALLFTLNSICLWKDHLVLNQAFFFFCSVSNFLLFHTHGLAISVVVRNGVQSALGPEDVISISDWWRADRCTLRQWTVTWTDLPAWPRQNSCPLKGRLRSTTHPIRMSAAFSTKISKADRQKVNRPVMVRINKRCNPTTLFNSRNKRNPTLLIWEALRIKRRHR